MDFEVDLATVALLESNPLVQVRMARALTAGSGFSSVGCADDVIQLPNLLSDDLKLLVLPSVEIDLGVHYASSNPNLRLVCVCNEVGERSLQTLDECEALSHLVGWPDFLTSPRSWDMALAAGMVLRPDEEWTWRHILPELSANKVWPLYSSFERDEAVQDVATMVRDELLDDRAADLVAEVAYEMAMNAMYDAPVDEHGRPKYGHDRHKDIALEDHEVPTLTLASDGTLVVLEVIDPFGRLKRSDVLEGIRRGLGARTAATSEEVLNTNQGGAGLGLFRMFQLASSLIFDVVDGERTRVLAVFDLSLRMRELRSFPTSIHLSFR